MPHEPPPTEYDLRHDSDGKSKFVQRGQRLSQRPRHMAVSYYIAAPENDRRDMSEYTGHSLRTFISRYKGKVRRDPSEQ
jgi:hypothetical protein